MDRAHLGQSIRYEVLKGQDPNASEPEIMARWVAETYRGSMDPDVLERACAWMRSQPG